MDSGPPKTFGRNWQDYLGDADEGAFQSAQAAMARLLDPGLIKGASFYDLGCGSGVHSLAAAELGAGSILSLDRDPDSVAACQSLKARHPHPNWQVRRASVLDHALMASLPPARVVYSWGVLHHTGSMWAAIKNAAGLCEPGGTFAIAIYNRTRTSAFWLGYKKIYQRSPAWLRWLMVQAVYLPRVLVRLARGKHPFKEARGMNIFRDAVDWCLGLPYEYATVAEIKDFVEPLGFALTKTVATRGIGCNEFVFTKTASSSTRGQ